METAAANRQGDESSEPVLETLHDPDAPITNPSTPILDGGLTKSGNEHGFDFKRWASRGIVKLSQEGLKIRGSGFVFKRLTVSAVTATDNVQETASSVLLTPFRRIARRGNHGPQRKIILSDFSGVVNDGELLAVLGRPGSGCSTLMKSIGGQLSGLHFNKGSDISFNGVYLCPDTHLPN